MHILSGEKTFGSISRRQLHFRRWFSRYDLWCPSLWRVWAKWYRGNHYCYCPVGSMFDGQVMLFGFGFNWFYSFHPTPCPCDEAIEECFPSEVAP